MNNQDYFHNALHHLYISPLEKCNLRCKICYTKKTSPILSENQIITFITRYNNYYPLQTITFCGGEVFTLPYFTNLVNILTNQGIFIQIITNASINRLTEMNSPNSINLIVSIDGMKDYHDKNRGKGSFDQCIKFLKDAEILKFHTEIFSIVTKQNLKHINEFESLLKRDFGNISITYHPRKPLGYLSNHPISNIVGHVEGFDFLGPQQLIELMKTKKTFPPKDLGCHQISLASDGKVYGCCESYNPLGKLTDSINQLIDTLKSRVDSTCFGCVQPLFMCGIKSIILTLNTSGVF